MSEPSLEQILRKLGYTRQWVEVGVIDEKLLRTQFNAYELSDDKNEEHYRYQAFALFLREKEGLNDNEVQSLLVLEDCGDDGVNMEASRAIMLLDSGLLTDQQLADLAEHPAVADSATRRVYVRQLMLRRLRSEAMSISLFEAIQRCGDEAVQRAALDRDDLDREHMEWLASEGANRRVRNVARQQLARLRI
jgi:hypothetical protein